MSKSKDYYWSKDLVRNIEEMESLSLSGKGRNADNYGCLHPPLINIPLNHVVPDELHLMLRITGN